MSQSKTPEQNQKIAIIGTGYVGLVVGACLADLGNEVICVDKNQGKIKELKKGVVSIYEPGLPEMVKRNKERGRLFFSTDLAKSIQAPRVVFVCVGTPPAQNGRVNLSNVEVVAQDVGKNIKEPKTVVIKSTVPAGTARNLVAKTIKEYWQGPFEVVSNPEFLREGSAISDFLNPDRIIIGVNSQEAAETLLQLYKDIDSPKIVTTLESAEMIKYASNAFLATKISFINEIANLCENTGADIEEVAKGVGLDRRIGPYFLKAGLGYGGSCFPKDVRALQQLAGANGYNFKLLQSVIEVNKNQRERVVEKVKSLFSNEGLGNKSIAVLGLAFKGNTDDVRESAALEIIEKLQKLGAKIRVYDPRAMENAKKVLNPGVTFCNSAYQATQNAEAVVIATEWEDFKKLDWEKIRNLVTIPQVVDGRNVLDPQELEKIGFSYIGVGRGIPLPPGLL